MPVTAKLSRKFYETFGDDITNELVEWFNVVDATYRSDLRELNELNYARFEAKLDQKMVELEKKMVELDKKMATQFERLRSELAGLRAEMIKWTFLFWIGMVVTVFVSRFLQP